jgi:hypothetical protein
MWLTTHNYTPKSIPARHRQQVMEDARRHAMQMADLAIEEQGLPPGGASLHLTLDQDAAQVFASLQAFTQMSAGDVIRHSIAVYEWLRQELHAGPAVTITREMCPHLAPKQKPHLRLV